MKAEKIKTIDKETMRILVTGGAGFIGSHLVDQLIKEHYKVIIVDDMSSGNRKLNLEKD